jgi:hypothetical protein
MEAYASRMFPDQENEDDTSPFSATSLIGAVVGAVVGLGTEMATGLHGLSETLGHIPAVGGASLGLLTGACAGAAISRRPAAPASEEDQPSRTHTRYSQTEDTAAEPESPETDRTYRDRVQNQRQSGGIMANRNR